MIGDRRTGRIYAGGGNPWFGVGVWQSDDRGATWTKNGDGLTYGEEDPTLKTVWSLAAAPDRLLAGVEPAGLFESFDDGRSWHHVRGLRDHPSRPQWQAGGGGLILHSILPHPDDPDRCWVGISAAGVCHTSDGGRNWEPRNRGTRADFLPEDQRYPEFGQCVHSVAMAAGSPERLYQQNHCGMYRSDDGGGDWRSIEAGLPSSFGFPCATHPRDPDTVYLLPLNGDIAGRFVPDAAAAVWRSRDGGTTWRDLRKGLPQENVYFAVLRQALAVDDLEPAGVYFGTNSGILYASTDEGDAWTPIAEHLPLIYSVQTMVLH